MRHYVTVHLPEEDFDVYGDIIVADVQAELQIDEEIQWEDFWGGAAPYHVADYKINWLVVDGENEIEEVRLYKYLKENEELTKDLLISRL